MLWKQETFGVLRPLQIEFFRNLLDCQCVIRLRTLCHCLAPGKDGKSRGRFSPACSSDDRLFFWWPEANCHALCLWFTPSRSIAAANAAPIGLSTTLLWWRQEQRLLDATDYLYMTLDYGST